MTNFKVFTLTNVVLAVLKKSACCGFLLDDGECFPQDQFCSCIESGIGDAPILEVSCSAHNLTEFPNFRKISKQIIEMVARINLTDNELTTIPTGVFFMFDGKNNLNYNYDIILRFERNKISTIENGAFVGINNLFLYINLTDNRITALPLAFQLLPRLIFLSLQGNPILTFDIAVVNSLAKSLDFLELDYKALISGNKELSVLNLTAMTIDHIPSAYGILTFNPFLFFRNTMQDMFIAGTELSTIPCSLIDGPVIEYFYLQDASNISAINVFDCQPGTRLNVVHLKIAFSGLEEFPDILKFTPYLQSLNLMHNKISSINENFIPLHNKLQELNLSYNRLRTIPAVFSRFDHLKHLNIEYNKITIVASESNVTSIDSLCATGNPWTHDGLYCDEFNFGWYDDRVDRVVSF